LVSKSDGRKPSVACKLTNAGKSAQPQKIELASVHGINHVHVTVNGYISMNRPLSPAQLEQDLAVRLRELLGQVEWLQGAAVKPVATPAGFDLLATLPLANGGQAALCVECKNELRPSLFGQMAGRKFAPAGKFKAVVRVLALPWVSPRVAELCAEHGWSWFDLAGNHRLDVPCLLRLQHTGNAPVYPAPKPTANLSTSEAGRVIRALLLPDNAGRRWTQREMQDHCRPSVSLGLVNKVVRHLRDEAFVEESDNGFRLREPIKLLLAWRDVYRFDRHERRGYFTLLQGKKLRAALAGLDSQTGGVALYASFSAAEFQAPHVRQPKTWLYVRQQELAKFEELAEAKPVDSGENLVVLIPDDEGVFYPGDGGIQGDNRLACTNAVQTYVDLWHSGGRGQEAADAVLEQRLKPEWKKRGMKK
jgi:hypothetical protein